MCKNSKNLETKGIILQTSTYTKAKLSRLLHFLHGFCFKTAFFTTDFIGLEFSHTLNPKATFDALLLHKIT